MKNKFFKKQKYINHAVESIKISNKPKTVIHVIPEARTLKIDTHSLVSETCLKEDKR